MTLAKTLLMTALGGLLFFSNAQATGNHQKKVAITAIVEHPALEEIRKGIIDQLATEGFVDGKTVKIDYQNAQGSSATAGQIATEFDHHGGNQWNRSPKQPNPPVRASCPRSFSRFG